MKLIVISEKIHSYRKENRLSLAKFSELINVSPQAVYKWEHSECYPAITMLPKLAELLGCSVDDFFRDV